MIARMCFTSDCNLSLTGMFHVVRQFGTSRPNTLACGLRKRPRSFLIRVTIVTPNKKDPYSKYKGLSYVRYIRRTLTGKGNFYIRKTLIIIRY